MRRTRSSSQVFYPLSATIKGYEGYSNRVRASRTNSAFIDEVSEKIEEIHALEQRLQRLCQETGNHDAWSLLKRIDDKIEKLGEEVHSSRSLGATSEKLSASEDILAIDEAIVEKIGSIGQALALIDLESGMGLEQDDLEGVLELLDDVSDLIKRRKMLIST